MLLRLILLVLKFTTLVQLLLSCLSLRSCFFLLSDGSKGFEGLNAVDEFNHSINHHAPADDEQGRSEGLQWLQYDEYGDLVIQDEYTFQRIKDQQEEMENAYNELSSSIEDLDDNLSMTGYKVRCITKIGIAYDDTFINTIEDFFGGNECVIVKTSSDEKTDLAMIQLKGKKTPESKYVFQLNREVEQFSFSDYFKKKHPEEMQIDQQLYMIGYNAGLVLASTKQGIKVQMTSGKVTQLPDGQRLMYSIPAIKGSSGSPVLNEWGEVIAVNFAGFGTTGDFNFGIPIEQVRKFKNQ